jgi:ABC-type uncharacterized transport system substrate-binding protein
VRQFIIDEPDEIKARQCLRKSAPDAIFANGTPVTIGVLQGNPEHTDRIRDVSDPVGDGIVASFARPGVNVTGFTNIEASMGGKWVEILKELAPSVMRVGLLFNPTTAPVREGHPMMSDVTTSCSRRALRLN